MTDDAVVEIGHVHGSVRAQLQIHGTEPWIVAAQKIRLLLRYACRAMVLQTIAIDSAGHYIAHENIALEFGRKILPCVKDDSADGSRPVRVGHHYRRKSQAVVRFSEARVVPAFEQLVNRRRMTVSRVEVAERIEHQSEWIHLAVSKVLDM